MKTSTIIISAIVLVGVAALGVYAINKKRKPPKGISSELKKIKDKFTHEYICYELSQYASLNNISCERLKKAYPAYTLVKKPPFISLSNITSDDINIELLDYNENVELNDEDRLAKKIRKEAQIKLEEIKAKI